MDSKSVLRIEPLHSGFLVFKGGGTVEYAYACTTIDDVKALIDETYGQTLADVIRMLPPHIQALQDHAQASDEAVS